MELEGLTGEALVEALDRCRGRGVGDVAGREVAQHAVLDDDQVAAIGDVGDVELDADVRRLEGSAPGVDGARVVTEHG